MPRAKKKPDLGHIADQLRPLAVEVSTLVEDPANARLHPTRNMEAITASLRRFGQRKPVVVRREGMIVEAGNGTLAAARALGWRHLAAVLVDDDATTATGFAIADNRTGELAEWDDAALARLLGSVKDEMPEIELGFSDEDLATLFEGVEADEDVAEDPGAGEPPAEPVSKRGEVYALGPHRLMCGDSLDEKDIDALMGGDAANMCFTDPPYNVAYNSQESPPGSAWGHTGKGVPIENDNMTPEKWREFVSGVASSILRCVRGCVYVCHAPGPDGRVMAAALDSALYWSGSIVWVKNQMVFGRASYQRRHESIWFGWPKKHEKTFTEDRTITDVWEFPKPRSSDLHPTMKPLELVEQAIGHASRKDQIIYDPFLGSGTTLIAAARQRRRCYGIEISPAYCDVIRKRWGDWSRAQGVDPGPDAL